MHQKRLHKNRVRSAHCYAPRFYFISWRQRFIHSPAYFYAVSSFFSALVYISSLDVCTLPFLCIRSKPWAAPRYWIWVGGSGPTVADGEKTFPCSQIFFFCAIMERFRRKKGKNCTLGAVQSKIPKVKVESGTRSSYQRRKV